ncbi:MAG TPA: HAD family hydrolase [Planctomycetes bacterium]|nr:HAD family hydrolase [Planctomycetota bacterium]
MPLPQSPTRHTQRPSRFRAVFLDVGGTLLHEVPPREAIYAEVAATHGRPLPPAEMRRRMLAAHHELGRVHDGAFRYSDPWFEEYIARIFGPGPGGLGLDEDRLASATAELFDRFESSGTFRLYPGARELLRDLRDAGLVLGVISNWSERLPRVLSALELDSAFDFVLSSAIEGVEKPDRALFELALERAGVPAEAALHAGDHPAKDVAGALDAGLDAVLVDHSGARGDLPGIRRVEGLAELATLVLSETA